MMKDYIALPTEDIEDGARIPENRSWTFQYGSQNKYHSIFTYSSSSTLNADFFDQGYIKPPPDSLSSLICHYLLVTASYFFLILTAPCTLWFSLKRLPQHERALVFRLGRMQSIKGPGLICVLPWIDHWQKVDLRMRAFSIPPQQLILIDGTIVEIGAEIRFRISDVIKSVTRIQNLDDSVRALGQVILVNSLHPKNVAELNTEKSIINGKIQAQMNAATLPWGLEVSQVEMSPPKVLQVGTGQASPLGSLLSSLQSVLQPTSQPLTSTPVSNVNTSKGNLVHSIMIDKVFPAVVGNGSPNSEGAIYKLEIPGNNGGTFWLDTKAGKTAIGGIAVGWGDPDVTATISSEHFISILNGKLSPLQAYICGHVQIVGNASLLNGLQGILSKLPTSQENFHPKNLTKDIQIV